MTVAEIKMDNLGTREEHIESIKKGVQELLEKHWNNNNELLKFEIRVATRENKDYSGFCRLLKKTYNPDTKEYGNEVYIDTEDYFKESE